MVTTSGIYLYCVPTQKILACHATHAGWKQWSIPKGLQETNETLWSAAIRELKEETGIVLNELNVLRVFHLPKVKYQKQNKTLESFLVITNNDLDNFPFHCYLRNTDSVPEVNTWRWITLTQAASWLHESQRRNLKLIRNYIKTNTLLVENVS